MKLNRMYIYGKHAVEEALTAMPQAVKKVFLAPRAADAALNDLIQETGVSVEPLDPKKVTSYVERNAPHQGIVALISGDALVASFDDFFKTLSVDSNTLLVLLGGITDPHNVGAIIRSAAAFGATAVLVPKQKQAPLTPAVIKTSAGMVFRIPIVELPNTQQAVSQLKEKGVKVHGLSGDAKKPVTAERFDSPTLLVLGNEGEGIPGYAKALCDQFLSIPLHPKCESLNVAAAAAVAMYAWSAKHPAGLK